MCFDTHKQMNLSGEKMAKLLLKFFELQKEKALLIGSLLVMLLNSPALSGEKNSSPTAFGAGRWIVQTAGLVSWPRDGINHDIDQIGDLVQNQLGLSPRLNRWEITGDLHALVGRKVAKYLTLGISYDYSTGSIGNDESYSQVPVPIPQVGIIPADMAQHFQNTYTNNALSFDVVINFRHEKRIIPNLQFAVTHYWFQSEVDLNFSAAAINMERIMKIKLTETAVGFTPMIGTDVFVTKNLFSYLKLIYPIVTIKGPANVTDNVNGTLLEYQSQSKIALTGFGILFGLGYSF